MVFEQGWSEPCIYGVYTVFWQEYHQLYGHIWCMHTILVDPTLQGCLQAALFFA